VFKGTTPVGVPVIAELGLDPAAKGPAFLAIASSTGAREGQQDSCIVVPGGFGKVGVTPHEPAFLRV